MHTGQSIIITINIRWSITVVPWVCVLLRGFAHRAHRVDRGFYSLSWPWTKVKWRKSNRRTSCELQNVWYRYNFTVDFSRYLTINHNSICIYNLICILVDSEGTNARAHRQIINILIIAQTWAQFCNVPLVPTKFNLQKQFLKKDASLII